MPLFLSPLYTNYSLKSNGWVETLFIFMIFLIVGLFIGFFMGIAGLVGHAFHGHVDYFLIIIMGNGAAIGSYIGANYTKKVSINTFLLILGIVLSVVGLILASRPLIT